jgi:hypothetical protein
VIHYGKYETKKWVISLKDKNDSKMDNFVIEDGFCIGCHIEVPLTAKILTYEEDLFKAHCPECGKLIAIMTDCNLPTEHRAQIKTIAKRNRRNRTPWLRRCLLPLEYLEWEHPKIFQLFIYAGAFALFSIALVYIY